MRLALIALVVAPAVASADVETEANRLRAAIRSRSPKAIAKRLGTSLFNAGVWFPDAACAKKFAKPGTVVAKEVGEFARCLSKLELQMSTRASARRGGAVLTYEPGIEVEVTFIGATVRWIGMPLHDVKGPVAATLTAQAFEELRTAGTTLLDEPMRDKLASESPTASAWIKTCLDASGTVTSATHHRETAAGVGDAFLAVIKDWRFKPFTHRGVAQPACSLTLLTFPAAKAPAVEVLPDHGEPAPDRPPSPPTHGTPYNVPPSLLETLRRSGSRQIAPTEATRKRMVADGKAKVVASVKMCLDVAGTVIGLTMLKSSGYADYDRGILSAMRTWTYRPYMVRRQAVDVCTAVTFIYDPNVASP